MLCAKENIEFVHPALIGLCALVEDKEGVPKNEQTKQGTSENE